MTEPTVTTQRVTSNALGPLAGLRVIDLTRVLSGPFATMLMADFGADVVKVEPPEGDLIRAAGPFLPDDAEHAYGGYFQSVNRNKRSIVLDLKSPSGAAALRRLAAGADVLVENFRVGVMDRLGLGYETLVAENPRLVYACIRGFGDPRTGESPYGNRPAFDITAQALGGLMGITGPGPEDPQKAGPGVGDLVPAMLCAFGILAAVRHAEATGQGQMVDVAMYDSIVALCERIVYQHSYTGQVPEPQGNSHPLFCPYDVYPTLDGAVTIAGVEDRLWVALTEAMGRPELATNPAYLTNADRARHAPEVRAAVTGWTSGLSRAEVLAALDGKVPCAPVQTAADIAADPHIAARGMVVEVEHPGSALPARIAGIPVKLTATPGEVRHRAPRLGEHTAEVLAEAGFSPQEIDALCPPAGKEEDHARS